jgi:hypothetical protein
MKQRGNASPSASPAKQAKSSARPLGLGCQPAEQPGYVGGEGGYDGNSDSA